MALTTGLFLARGRSVLVGVEAVGIEPTFLTLPSWGFS